MIHFKIIFVSIDKIREVQLSDNRGRGFDIMKKPNFIITIRYEIPMFSLVVGPFFEYGVLFKRSLQLVPIPLHSN